MINFSFYLFLRPIKTLDLLVELDHVLYQLNAFSLFLFMLPCSVLLHRFHVLMQCLKVKLLLLSCFFGEVSDLIDFFELTLFDVVKPLSKLQKFKLGILLEWADGLGVVPVPFAIVILVLPSPFTFPRLDHFNNWSISRFSLFLSKFIRCLKLGLQNCVMDYVSVTSIS